MSQTNPFSLRGQMAAVTGGGRGLGRAITESLLHAGADVVVLARQALPEDLMELAAGLGREVSFVGLDLGDSEEIGRVVPEILSERPVDILVNNAGLQIRHPAVEFPLDEFDQVMNVNLRSVFDLAQRFGAPMIERGRGKIINIASLTTFQGGLFVPAYAAAKGAVGQLTKALCNEWATSGVNVNAIAPGYIVTDLNTALLNDPVRSEQIGQRIPSARWGTPEDLGGAAVFLASSASDYVNGIVLPVDGGWLAR